MLLWDVICWSVYKASPRSNREEHFQQDLLRERIVPAASKKIYQGTHISRFFIVKQELLIKNKILR